MKEIGYSAKSRLKVIQDGTRAYEKQLLRERSGVCPIYRPKGYQKEIRRAKKRLKKVSWYPPHHSVLFIS